MLSLKALALDLGRAGERECQGQSPGECLSAPGKLVLLFYGLQGKFHPHHVEQSVFCKDHQFTSYNLHLNLTQNNLTETSRRMFDQALGHPVAQPN